MIARAVLVAMLALLLPTTANAVPALRESGPVDAPAALIVYHGGGWLPDGGDAYLRAMDSDIARFDDAWRVFNVQYASGGQSVLDALAAYDQVRSIVGDRPVCVLGESAGGHLALIVAERRNVACAIVHAGIIDTDTVGGMVGMFARNYFHGTANPIDHADGLPPTIIAQAYNDPLVPFAQTGEVAGLSQVQIIGLPDGPVNFTHRQVNGAALNALHERERAFADQEVGNQ